jgi:hypothetical protein
MNIAASSPQVRSALANDAVSPSAVDSPMLEQVFAVNVATVNSGFASQNLLIQLRSHYPSGCLAAELVQVVAGDYVVRAIVSVDDLAIATALAAAATVEQAEDQARARVMAVLGLTLLPLTEIKPEIKPSVGKADRLPDPAPIVDVPIVMDSVVEETIIEETATEPAATEPAATEPAATEPAAIEEAAVDFMAEAKSAVKSTRSKAKATKSKAGKSEPEAASDVEFAVESAIEPEVELAVAPPAIEITGGLDESDEMEIEYEFTVDEEPEMTAAETLMADPIEPMIDLSDAIAQIGAEIERIGWTRKQGSAYLQETYGKRTRAELTEPELLNFLHYLKALPSKLQPALSDLPF